MPRLPARRRVEPMFFVFAGNRGECRFGTLFGTLSVSYDPERVVSVGGVRWGSDRAATLAVPI
jgi:hypothetical protein